MRIFLIGLSGTGKSSFGKKLAAKLGCSFIDLDQLVEESANVSITKIFEDQGEEAFRLLESNALKGLLDAENTVISCGGGLPCYKNNMDLMLSSGIVILLQVPVGVIAKRLEDSYERPLLVASNDSLEHKLKTMWDARKSYYLQAHIQIEYFNWNARKMDDLIRQIKKG